MAGNDPEKGSLDSVAGLFSDAILKAAQDPEVPRTTRVNRPSFPPALWRRDMYAVLGIGLLCGGLVFFFFMLHLHRRPGVAHWLATRAVGEITVFTSMMISLYGIAMIGQHFINPEGTFGWLEDIEGLIIIGVSVLAIWKLYLPPPPLKNTPVKE
ncbi:MAG: hypothetical protein VW709_02560 [Rickettsiales bacterium]